MDKLNKYYNMLHATIYTGIATICNLQFNFNVF